jgi:hypothetical protein
MSSTFTTPLRINKRNNPTNNGVIAPSNTGAALVSQQQFFLPISAPQAAGALPTYKFGETTPTAFVIPAGSIIQEFQLYLTSAPSAITGGAITASISVTDPLTGVVTTTQLATSGLTIFGGILNFGQVLTPTVTSLLANTGPLDVVISFAISAITAITGTAAGTISMSYTARNADGSITAYGANLSNN